MRMLQYEKEEFFENFFLGYFDNPIRASHTLWS